MNYISLIRKLNEKICTLYEWYNNNFDRNKLNIKTIAEKNKGIILTDPYFSKIDTTQSKLYFYIKEYSISKKTEI